MVQRFDKNMWQYSNRVGGKQSGSKGQKSKSPTNNIPQKEKLTIFRHFGKIKLPILETIPMDPAYISGGPKPVLGIGVGPEANLNPNGPTANPITNKRMEISIKRPTPRRIRRRF
jgi:hypothetical protein